MSTNVERCELAPGLSISRLLTGLWQVADMERDGRALDLDAAAAAMAPYVTAGFTTFDMADHYGSAEEIAGRFRASLGAGQHAELCTKWVPQPGPVTRDEVRTAVQRSLDRLRVDAVDLMQFHAWTFADPRWLDCLFWLQELKAEGLIRQIGLTNFDTAHLRVAVASGVEAVSNQVSFSLLDQRARTRMAPFCVEHKIKLLAYGTVAGGLLTERWLGKPEPEWGSQRTWSEMKYGRFVRAAGGWASVQGLLRAVDVVAKRHSVSMANVACRYILDEPAVAGVIVGARLGASEHIADNQRVFQFKLDPEDRQMIADAIGMLTPIPNDCGDEYRQPPYLTASGDLSHHVDAFPSVYAAQHGPGDRTRCTSGTSWEAMAGYSRAVRVGNSVWVSGTTATHGDRVIGGTDPAAQAHFAIDKIEAALHSLGAQLSDVVRTRVFVNRIADWEAIARVHGERFGAIRPANTLVQAALVGAEYLVEIEADAVVASSSAVEGT